MMFRRRRGSVNAAFSIVAILLLTDGCSAPRPVLYPNQQYQKVGDAVAQQDADDCMQRADQFVKSGGVSSQTAANAAKQTAVGGAGGAAVGAVGGAITGNAAQGAAVGAATGATAGLLHSLFSSAFQQGPSVDPVYASFVDRCLREKGYEPIGWK